MRNTFSALTDYSFVCSHACAPTINHRLLNSIVNKIDPSELHGRRLLSQVRYSYGGEWNEEREGEVKKEDHVNKKKGRTWPPFLILTLRISFNSNSIHGGNSNGPTHNCRDPT
jgi:hypothetical protein